MRVVSLVCFGCFPPMLSSILLCLVISLSLDNGIARANLKAACALSNVYWEDAGFHVVEAMWVWLGGLRCM